MNPAVVGAEDGAAVCCGDWQALLSKCVPVAGVCREGVVSVSSWESAAQVRYKGDVSSAFSFLFSKCKVKQLPAGVLIWEGAREPFRPTSH